MGCVSFKGFSRGPDEASWYLPMSHNSSASANRQFSEEKDADYGHVFSLPSSSYGDNKAETGQGSFLNINRTKMKQCKVLSPDNSFAFAQPILHCKDSNDTHASNKNMGMKPFGIHKSGAELDDEQQHFLLCDYLHMQHMVGSKGTKGSWLDDESKGPCMGDADAVVKNERNDAGIDFLLQEGDHQSNVEGKSLDVSHAGASTGSDFAELLDCIDERKSGFRQHNIEIINMHELMEGLEDNSRTPSSLRSSIRGTLSIPDREISLNAFPGLTSAPRAGDLGSPVWKKYYMPDNGVACTNAWNRCSPASGSPFNESPRRAPSQSSFLEVDDSRSVSSVELPDASAIGLKILLSPANSSFHPSPMNKAHSVVSSVDGIAHGTDMTNGICDGSTTHVSGSLYEVNNPYISRNRSPSMESMSGGFIEHEFVGIDMKNMYKSPPNITRSSSRRPSMESGYESGSPLFDPSLMATFEEALKASTGASGYDDWLPFSVDESITLSSSSANTWESFDTSMDAKSSPPEQITETSRLTIPIIYEYGVMSKGDLTSYEIRCPPRGEGKVVLYFTSLRGVRKTYEDCFNVRLILRGLGVRVDERDVWMHSEFKSELSDVLNGLFMGMPRVPQLFVKGRYVGGAETVMRLHEEGVLSCLMEGLAMCFIHSVCSGCGDARFIPCLTCNGSCKVLNVVNEVTHCLACNENGLIMCPMCII
ncbi:hypothetical protein GOP47_0004588 [Adiantum capillus-veneris]|uniref:Glutaredoxin domain-containing protein n=1 Tax=Adiantum capillus-veneris TaxID=13818 RepID=A0A9D4V7Q4_ADICA|nr:hypothetical protein GOP47_0004588 [Adiantum capillus-veneris]